MIILIAFSLYFIFKDKKDMKKTYLALLIFFTGFISRYVMAFSPTVYASGERTSLFWYISICMLIVSIYNELIKSSNKVVKTN